MLFKWTVSTVYISWCREHKKKEYGIHLRMAAVCLQTRTGGKLCPPFLEH